MHTDTRRCIHVVTRCENLAVKFRYLSLSVACTHHPARWAIPAVQEPLSLGGTSERYVRPQLRKEFMDLCTLPICHYLDRFGFKSDLIKAMYATTDAFSGLSGGYDSPGTGMNFLVHNMCALSCCLSCIGTMKPSSSTTCDELAVAAVETRAHLLQTRIPYLLQTRIP